MGTTLSNREREIVYALGEVMFPASKSFGAYTWEDVDLVERALAKMTPLSIRSVKGMLHVVNERARLNYVRSMRHLSPAKRTAYIEKLRTGTWVEFQAFRLVSLLMKIAYYDKPGYYEKFNCRYACETGEPETGSWWQQVTQGSDITEDLELEAEAVVVGTGAGGAVVASELASQGHAVVMVESGDYFTRRTFDGRAWDRQQDMWFLGGNTMTVGNCLIYLPIGETVGGTTTVNSGTCFRTPRPVLRKWRENFGLCDLTPANLEPHFAKMETGYRVTTADMKYVGPTGKIIGRGADELGYSHGPLPRNAPDCDGQGVCVFGCPTDAKRGTNVSFVPDALKNNAFLISRTVVDEILVKNGTAYGVRGRSKDTGRKVTIKARCVVLACGALLTPLLLMKNKLANSSGWLGKNLSVHPATSLVAVMDEVVDGYNFIPQGYQINEFHEEGILFEGATTPFAHLPVFTDFVGEKLQSFMEQARHLSTFGFMVSDSSVGRVLPAANFRRPLITYWMDQTTLDRILRGMEILSRVFLAAGARTVMLPLHGITTVHHPTELHQHLDRPAKPMDLDLSAYHPLGTARMGANPREAVVNSSGETFDVRNLFIADGSVVPTSTNVNPMITIGALSSWIAQFVGQRIEQSVEL